MPYEKRVGERMEVGDLQVRWTHLHANRVQKQGRSKRRRRSEVDHEDAYMRNVSASGVGIVARADDSIAPGTTMQVHVDAEASFVAKVRRIVPTSDPGFWYYGVEIVEETEAYRTWMHNLLDLRRDSVITESHWRSAF